MGRFLKIIGLGMLLGWAVLVYSPATEAQAVIGPGGRPAASYYYTPNPYYYPGPVVVEPLLLPRTGSNDYLYQYDNVYGAGASAAGRFDRVVNNPPPQLFYPRQPRVYYGY